MSEFGHEEMLTNFGSPANTGGTGMHQFAHRASGPEYRGGLITSGGSNPSGGHGPFPEEPACGFSNAEFYGEGPYGTVLPSNYGGR